MWIIFDITVIAIIALSTFIGYKQGLVKSAIKILSFFIAIVVALVLYKPVSGIIIKTTPIDDNIKNVMLEKITPERMNTNQDAEVSDNIGIKIIGGAINTVEEVADAFAVKLIEIVTLLLIYLITKIALKFVTALTDLITKLPLLKQINKAGGTAYGIIRGVILVYTILAIVYLVAPLLNKTVSENLDKSIITKALYNNNIILNIIA